MMKSEHILEVPQERTISNIEGSTHELTEEMPRRGMSAPTTFTKGTKSNLHQWLPETLFSSSTPYKGEGSR
jgi:hypothetical protein